MGTRTLPFPATCLLALYLAIVILSGHCQAKVISWSGYDWWVRTSGGDPQGPGPNIFSNSQESVFVDTNGDLHLKIRQGNDGKWLASEINLNQSLGYGTYEWEVSSRYDLFANNAVGGLFTYLSPQSVASQTGGEVGNGIADTPHEIDVEFTKAWGSANLHLTTHDPDVPSPSENFFQQLNGNQTTHRFKWEPDRITWGSYNGHVAGVENPPYPIVEQRAGPNFGNPAEVVYEGPVIPQDLDEIVAINFWISSNNPSIDGPTGGAEQEMIIRSFTYTPIAGDFNDDGKVDLSDYAIWSQSFGSTSELSADANNNGVVDASDYTIWRDNQNGIGTGIASAQSELVVMNVPEPHGLFLVTYAVACFCRSRRFVRINF